jgi:two-component system cell cycle response regulator DivK
VQRQRRDSAGEIRRRVLVIDDYEEARRIYAEHFARADCLVETASDGNEGIAIALRMRPHVIVLDLTMPGLDGWETARVLRAYPTTATVPIVVVTAVEDEALLARTMALGCNAVLRKPCSPEELEEVIGDVLREAPDSDTPHP